MNNFFKKVILLLSIFILSIFVLSGCSKNNEVQPLIKNYEKLLNEGNYEALYDNISKKSKEYISKEEFIKRYSSIYSGIGANDIKISIGEINSKTQIPISITMNTLAGKLKFEDIKVDIVKEDKNYKINWNESLILPPMTKGDKIGVEVDKAVRGQILDRDNNKLAYDGKAYQVNIHPSVFTANKDENLPKFAEVLDVSMDKISEKIENQNPDHKIPILKVPQYENEKIDLLKTIEGVIIDEVDSRVYQNSEALGCLIGYTDNITKEELEKYKGKDYNSQSKIGKSGLEQVYEDKLRARDGVHIFIKRGEEKITLAKKEPINGENIKLSIDSKLQENIYAQMNNEKGASVALHPQTGEVLAMVSSPSYNSNTKVTYITKQYLISGKKVNMLIMKIDLIMHTHQDQL